MILSKFSPFSLFSRIKVLSIQLLALSLLSCNKTANINKNKAFLALTNVAYGTTGPLNIYIEGEGDSIFSMPVFFGQNSGTPGNRYDTTTSRVAQMMILENSDTVLRGLASFRQGAYYSIFVFDTLNPESLSLLILQDNPPAPTDSTTSARFINFSPGSSFSINSYLGLKLVNPLDTVVIQPQYFIAYNPNPNSYSFTTSIHYGNYAVFAYTDSSNPTIDSLIPKNDSSNFRKVDSLQFNYLVNYNIYLQGFFGITTGPDTLKLVSVPLN